MTTVLPHIYLVDFKNIIIQTLQNLEYNNLNLRNSCQGVEILMYLLLSMCHLRF